VLERWTRAVLRHRALTLGLWILVVALGALASVDLPHRLTTSLAVPGSPSAAANVILQQDFGENVEGTFTVVVPVRHDTKTQVAAVAARVEHASDSLPGARVTQSQHLLGLLYVNVSTPYSLARAADLTGRLRDALAHTGVVGALVTGPPALEHDVAPVLAADLHHGELLALLVALALLLGALGLCGAVALPFAMAAATAGGALGLIDLVARATTMVLYVPNVVALIALGLSIDYALLLVHRFRTEVEGADLEEAIVATMASAGRTILTSGICVAVGLVALLVTPVPFLRSLGLAALSVPLLALAAASTLLPVLLSLRGARGVRPWGVAGLLARRGAWERASRAVVRRPAASALVSAGLLLVVALGALALEVTPAAENSVPSRLPSERALALVSRSVGPGVATPVEVIVDTGRPGAVDRPAQRAARLRLATAVLADPETFLVAIGPGAAYADPSARYARIFVVTRHGFGDPATRALVARVQDRLIPAARFPTGDRVLVGGAPGQGRDFLDSLYGAFPWTVALALALALIVLTRAFASLVLALLAVALDLVSVACAYGVTAVVFRYGLGTSLGLYRAAQLEGWVPVFAFAVLFGLSSDYEVFLVSRMREARERGATARDAVVEGLTATGPVVTTAALILVGALVGLASGRVAGLQELGVALIAGVALDAVVVRGVLLPSLMTLLGERAWWRPAWTRPRAARAGR
jgi:RND superfamily putative drug exporter